jgi:DNA-binding HxlR family transcriptional regulator
MTPSAATRSPIPLRLEPTPTRVPDREPTDYEMIEATQRVLDLLGRKWSVGVLYLLANGTRRYSEVLYEVGEVSKKALTQTLRSLERDGLIARRAYPEVPTRVEYSLTRLGWNMTALLMSMYEWASEHMPHIDAARPIGPMSAAEYGVDRLAA